MEKERESANQLKMLKLIEDISKINVGTVGGPILTQLRNRAVDLLVERERSVKDKLRKNTRAARARQSEMLESAYDKAKPVALEIMAAEPTLSIKELDIRLRARGCEPFKARRWGRSQLQKILRDTA